MRKDGPPLAADEAKEVREKMAARKTADTCFSRVISCTISLGFWIRQHRIAFIGGQDETPAIAVWIEQIG
jgi:hypothetical protein